MINKIDCYICLGSNCDDSLQYINSALSLIQKLDNLNIISKSSIYSTQPQDYISQPWFLNQVIKCSVDSSLNPENLLFNLLDIEKQLGRIRNSVKNLRYGPRVIDLDLLLFGDIHSNKENCILPHPRMTKRAFVLIPLLEIEPNILINNIQAKEYLNSLIYKLIDRKIYQ